MDLLRGCCTGAAWLSSVRAVRCLVKSSNERNPYRQLPAGDAGDSGRTAGASREEGGDDVKSARPLRPGLHTCYNGWYREQVPSNVDSIMKAIPSSDWGLQPDPMKSDLLVTAHQLRRRECVPGPCTHRPSHHESRLHPKSGIRRPKVWVVIGMKS